MLQSFIQEGCSLGLEKEANFDILGVSHCKDYLSLVLWTMPEPKMFEMTYELILRNTLYLVNKL